jgi:hypothetical protein
MEWHSFLELLAMPVVVGAYKYLRGEGIFKETFERSSGILAGSPSCRLESLLTKVDAYAMATVIAAALICALSAVVLAVARGDADRLLVCCLIAISGMLCRIVLPVSGIRATTI